LQEKLSLTKKTYADLKMAHAISPIENPLQIRSVEEQLQD
jgi:large subunit ribosomal protein L29